MNTVKQTISGGFGGISLVASGHPLDTLKVRMQTMVVQPGQPPPYKNALDCAMQTVRKEGFLALYRGMLGPLVGVTPMYAMVFAGYGVGQSIFTTEETYERMSIKDLGLIGLAGATSSVFSTPLMTPMERVKCILQMQGTEAARAAGQTRVYGGIKECLVDTYAEGGIRNLYRGFWSTMLRDGLASFFYFSTYALLRKKLTPEGETSPGVLATLFAGGTAGVLNWAGCFPVDTMKSRYQTAPLGRYPNGIRSVFKEIVATEGAAALFRGASPVFLRAFPANACAFLGVELSMKAMNYMGM